MINIKKIIIKHNLILKKFIKPRSRARYYRFFILYSLLKQINIIADKENWPQRSQRKTNTIEVKYFVQY